MALTRDDVERIAHETAVRAVIRHEQRFQMQGVLMGILGWLLGEVFRRVTGLDAIAFLISKLG